MTELLNWQIPFNKPFFFEYKKYSACIISSSSNLDKTS